MPIEPEPPQMDARWNNLPAFFVVRQIWVIFIIGFVIPLIFLLFTVLKLSAIPTNTAQEIVELLRPVWPILPENYEGMRKLGRLSDANNYALFFLAMTAFALLLVVIALLKYSNRSEPVNFPDVVLDGMFILLGAVGYYLLSRGDRIKLSYPTMYDFYPDQTGFYYFRTYILVASIYFFGLVLVISVIRIFYGRPSEAV